MRANAGGETEEIRNVPSRGAPGGGETCESDFLFTEPKKNNSKGKKKKDVKLRKQKRHVKKKHRRNAREGE